MTEPTRGSLLDALPPDLIDALAALLQVPLPFRLTCRRVRDATPTRTDTKAEGLYVRGWNLFLWAIDHGYRRKKHTRRALNRMVVHAVALGGSGLMLMPNQRRAWKLVRGKPYVQLSKLYKWRVNIRRDALFPPTADSPWWDRHEEWARMDTFDNYFSIAAFAGHLEFLEWCEKRRPRDWEHPIYAYSIVQEEAARGGHIHILKWCRAHIRKWARYEDMGGKYAVPAAAARGGHLDGPRREPPARGTRQPQPI